MGAIILTMLVTYGEAPFCVVDDYRRECYYYDISSCKRAAARINGLCESRGE